MGYTKERINIEMSKCSPRAGVGASLVGGVGAPLVEGGGAAFGLGFPLLASTTA